MKKLLIFCILQVALLNAYTLVLNDNSFVKGELVYIADTYTLMNVDGKPKKISNSIIKKRFYTAEELAAIEKKKQQETARQEEIIRQEEIAKQKVAKQEAVAMQEEQTYMMRVIKEDNEIVVESKNIAKYNVFLFFDLADKVYVKGSSPSVPGVFKGKSKQDMTIGIGAEYNAPLFNKTRYSVGATYQLERKMSEKTMSEETMSLGAYSGASIFSRIEHPFDRNNENNVVGIELNMFFASYTKLPDHFTNNKIEPDFGFAIYERRYVGDVFYEIGFKSLRSKLNTVIETDLVNYLLDSPGLYFLVGMTF